MSTVSIQNLVKSYGPAQILKQVSVQIADGEFTVLVGPSGCGKSTLLRMIAGLETITSGEIAIGGALVNEVAPKDRDIAMVFQSYALYPHMTIWDNMDFSLKLKGMSKADRAARITRAAEILGLVPLLKRKPAQLSGGQRQRVAMGRAIVRDPQVFLFDEPLSNLDAKLRVEMRAEIKALQHRLGTTTIYVTHDQVEAMTMADRIVVMRDGRIEQCDTPLNLYDRPANIFVAGFIGSPAMNFLRGRAGDGVFVTEDGIRLPLPDRYAGVSGPVTYGIRPEHLDLGSEETGRGLEATIKLTEPTGSETMVLLALGAQSLTGVFRARITAPEGASLQVRPQTEHVHLFDATGARI